MSWYYLQWHQLSVIFCHHLQTSTIIQRYVSISLSMWGNLDFPVGTIFPQLASSFERKGTEARFDSSCISPSAPSYQLWGKKFSTKIGKFATVSVSTEIKLFMWLTFSTMVNIYLQKLARLPLLSAVWMQLYQAPSVSSNKKYNLPKIWDTCTTPWPSLLILLWE